MNFSDLLEGYPELAKIVVESVDKARDFCNFLLSGNSIRSLFLDDEIDECIRRLLGVEMITIDVGSIITEFHVRKGTKMKHGRYLRIDRSRGQHLKKLLYYRNDTPYYKLTTRTGYPLKEVDAIRNTKKLWERNSGGKSLRYYSSPTIKKRWSDTGKMILYHDKLSGEIRELDEYGKKKRIGNINRNGNFTGVMWKYHKKKHDLIRRWKIIKTFRQEEKTTCQRVYVCGENYSKKGRYLAKTKIKTGRQFYIKKYSPDGDIQRSFRKQGNVLDGMCFEYCNHKNNKGRLEGVKSYLDGDEHGPYVLYYPNGVKKEKGCHKNDGYVGKRVWYTPWGQVKKIKTYNVKVGNIFDESCGKCKKWDPQGNVRWKRISNHLNIHCFRGREFVGVTSGMKKDTQTKMGVKAQAKKMLPREEYELLKSHFSFVCRRAVLLNVIEDEKEMLEDGVEDIVDDEEIDAEKWVDKDEWTEEIVDEEI